MKLSAFLNPSSVVPGKSGFDLVIKTPHWVWRNSDKLILPSALETNFFQKRYSDYSMSVFNQSFPAIPAPSDVVFKDLKVSLSTGLHQFPG
jgi:hypothetical protein